MGRLLRLGDNTLPDPLPLGIPSDQFALVNPDALPDPSQLPIDSSLFPTSVAAPAPATAAAGPVFGTTVVAAAPAGGTNWMIWALLGLVGIFLISEADDGHTSRAVSDSVATPRRRRRRK